MHGFWSRLFPNGVGTRAILAFSLVMVVGIMALASVGVIVYLAATGGDVSDAVLDLSKTYGGAAVTLAGVAIAFWFKDRPEAAADHHNLNKPPAQ